MRLLGYVLSILGVLTVIAANINLSTQMIDAILNFLGTVSQLALRYVSNLELTVSGLAVVVIGLALILLSYRR